MDKVDQEKRNSILLNRKKQFEEKAGNFKIKCFPTSIWENSLYKAWSNILGNIIPNKDKIKELLEKFNKACQSDEVILFEKNIFLYISSFNSKEIKDNERIEKICVDIKKFKNTCQKETKKFKNFLLKNKGNFVYLDEFENSTCIMVSFSNKSVSLELIKINIEIVKKLFKELMNK